MMQFGPFGYMNSPQLTQLAPFLYGYRPSSPQLFRQPLQKFFLWPQQTPVHQAARLPERKPHQTPVARQPIPRPQLRPQMPQLRPQTPQLRPQLRPHMPRLPHKPIQQQPHSKTQVPPKKPPNISPPQTHPQEPTHQSKGVEQQQPQILFPNQQHLWNFPQVFNQGGFYPQLFNPFQGHMPVGFGRPPISNEEGTPYYGYGYPGLGNRLPYNSEEFEQDYEKPKEKDPPAPDPAINATDTNATLSNPSSPAGNATNSGLSAIDSRTNVPNLESVFHIGNGVPTLSSTLQVSEGDAAAQNGMDQSVHRASSPNINHLIQNLPPDKQQSTGNSLHVYKPYPGVDDSRHNTYISRGNPSGHPENPTYPSIYGESVNQRGNLQNINNNNPSINTRLNSYGQQEHPHYPEKNPLDQRQMLPFPSSAPQSQWNNDPVYRDMNLNSFPPEHRSVDPRFNTLGQTDQSYYTRKDTDFQPSQMHQVTSLSPQGVFLPTKRTLSEAETHQYHWKEQNLNSAIHERGQFPPPRNPIWNKQEDLQVFQDDPPRYNSRYSPGYFNQREHISNPEQSPYDQPSRSFYPDQWEGRENSPALDSTNQREPPLYSPGLPSNQINRNSYHRSDSFVQQEHETYPRPTPWAHEKHLLDQDREYRNPPYIPTQQHAYPKYSPENPSNQRRGNVPYKEISPWIPEEHSPPYAAEHLRQTETIPYQRSNAFGHRERNFQEEGVNSPPRSIRLPQGESQYSRKITWGPHRTGSPVQKEASPYFNSYSPDFRRNPTHMDDTGGIHVSRVNIADRRNYPDRLGYLDGHRSITSYPSSRRLCCADNFPVIRESSLAPLRSVPQFRLAPWEQRGSSHYPETEGSQPKQVSRTLYPSGMQSLLDTEKSQPNQQENLDLFGEDVAGLEKASPCSKSQLGQQSGHEISHDTGLTPTRNTPCYGRSIRGDRHSILERIIQPKREHQRAAAVRFVAKQGPPAHGIKSADFDSEGEQQAVLGFNRIPCLVNQLRQYLSSTTAPSGDKQQDLFYAENPTLIRKSFIALPEPHPLSSTNPSNDTEEKPSTPSSPGLDLADQPNEKRSDCLLLQK
uniref:Uncharacterized protein n=2 Tax=Sphaerodactylus townsendi TaxID=933632 RepID=A0ACB8ES47_9SAUR